MELKSCDICNKKIEGYNKNHVEYLMTQHKLTHKDKIEKKEEVK